MGGNNNFMSKKGWNPSNMANQVKVGEAEAAAIRTRKEEKKREEEVRKERAQEAIKRQQAEATGKVHNARVDWMYEGPSSGGIGTKEEQEAMLLGKSSINRYIKDEESEKIKKAAGVEDMMAMQTVNQARDIQSKIREDPMLAIKRQEQAAYEKLMSDPRKREQLLAVIGGEAPKERSETKHRYHHRRHRDDERDSKRRRTDGDEKDGGSSRHHRSNRRSRSRTPDSRSPGRRRSEKSVRSRESRSLSPRGERDGRGSRRRPRSYSRSKSPPRRRRSPSDSRSPPRRRRSPSRSPVRRAASPPRRRDDMYRRKHSPPRTFDKRGNYNRPNNNYSAPRPRDASPQQSAEERQAEMARKLAEMQQSATELDVDRQKRLAALEEQDKAQRKAEEAARMKASRYGGKADFVNQMSRQVGEKGLADRLGRGRQGLEAE